MPEDNVAAVYFLWHFPWDCSPWPLASTLSYGARTFLETFPLTGMDPRLSLRLLKDHDTPKATRCHRKNTGELFFCIQSLVCQSIGLGILSSFDMVHLKFLQIAAEKDDLLEERAQIWTFHTVGPTELP